MKYNFFVKRLLPGAVLVAVLFRVVPFAYATEIKNFKAYGSAEKARDTARTRKAAIESAIAQAVMDAASELPESKGIDPGFLETDIKARAGRFIVNYRILSERWMRERVIEEPPAEENPSEAEIEERPKGEEGREEGRVIDSYHVLIETGVDLDALRKELGMIKARISAEKIKVVVLDVMDYETYGLLLAAIRRLPAVNDLSYDRFTRGRFVMRIRSTLDAAALAGEIAREAGKDFLVTEGGPGTIIVKAFPAAPEEGGED